MTTCGTLLIWRVWASSAVQSELSKYLCVNQSEYLLAVLSSLPHTRIVVARTRQCCTKSLCNARRGNPGDRSFCPFLDLSLDLQSLCIPIPCISYQHFHLA
ncbi:hypothetical protein F4777DRAFT_315628 [Nemania sp. FL0916]|nr:hypothetical protein F4777DRAFT_315628 [Nemania sp. FL0916]